MEMIEGDLDAPRAGSAEAKIHGGGQNFDVIQMHPVQAAPRQSWSK